MYDENNPPPVVHHEDQLTTGVVVPGAQALITGVLVGIAAGAISAWFGLPAWGVAGTAAAVAALGAWLSYRGRWAWLLERAAGVDLNNDSFIGQPPAPPPLRIDLTQMQDGARERDFIDLPVDQEKARLLAQGLLNGRQFSLSVWAGPTQLFTRSEFEALRSELLARGLATWRNPHSQNQGIVLTGAGRAVMRHLADQPPYPTGGRDGRV